MELSPQLKRSIRIFRYVVYVCLVALSFLQAWSIMFPVSTWISLLVLIPLLWQGLSDRGYLGWSHTLEALSVPALLWVLDLHLASLGFAAITALCNLSLWGSRLVPGIASGLTLLVVTAIHDISLVILAGWLITFACLVNGQARHHLNRKAQLKNRQADLMKFLPKDFAGEDYRRDWLTVGFLDLGGFTKAVDQMSPEMTRAVLNQFLGRVVTVVEAAGGSVNKFLGDGVLCVFAAQCPESRRDAAMKSVRAITEIEGWMPEFVRSWRARGCMLDFDLSAGIASGDCAIGSWGEGERLDFTVIGTPVNLAQRLQTEASATCPILLDEVTAELVGAQYLGQRNVIEPKGLNACEAYPLDVRLLQKA